MSIAREAPARDASAVVRRSLLTLIIAGTPLAAAASCDPFTGDSTPMVIEAGADGAFGDAGEAGAVGDARPRADSEAGATLACEDLAPQSFMVEGACAAELASTVTPCDPPDAGQPSTGDACAAARRSCRCVLGSSGWDLLVRSCECR